MDALADLLREEGLNHVEIAAEVSARYRVVSMSRAHRPDYIATVRMREAIAAVGGVDEARRAVSRGDWWRISLEHGLDRVGFRTNLVDGAVVTTCGYSQAAGHVVDAADVDAPPCGGCFKGIPPREEVLRLMAEFALEHGRFPWTTEMQYHRRPIPASWSYRYYGSIFRARVEMAELVNAKVILHVRNAHVRSRMIERAGHAEFLAESGAEPVAVDECGKLWRVKDRIDQLDLVLVEVANSTPEPDGSFRSYFIRVPPTVETPLEAVAWTFEMTGDEYRPLVQT